MAAGSAASVGGIDSVGVAVWVEVSVNVIVRVFFGVLVSINPGVSVPPNGTLFGEVTVGEGKRVSITAIVGVDVV